VETRKYGLTYACQLPAGTPRAEMAEPGQLATRRLAASGNHFHMGRAPVARRRSSHTGTSAITANTMASGTVDT
jgi:hypothetical protein